MRAVVQRVKKSSVNVDGKTIGSIGKGLNVLVGVEDGDSLEDVKYLAEKIINLRIFEDENEKMNLSLLDVKGEMLAISQFTLLGDCRKGRRPSFITASRPEIANELYENFVSICSEKVIKVETGKFQADMQVEIINDGPVTLMIDSKKVF
ncbi:D-aminoacyl-tRNA deacylase [Helicovermis profundi]|uniref:D-aminoacyl-tRNA deacylase n=1 Tax=Helicovermis profundi TaxID=3065157 RepID=A0AAU9EEJ8_9FIRM|nr:D-aminoacyl-tRNA deacylase [Clostridia bacterium S502]